MLFTLCFVWVIMFILNLSYVGYWCNLSNLYLPTIESKMQNRKKVGIQIIVGFVVNTVITLILYSMHHHCLPSIFIEKAINDKN